MLSTVDTFGREERKEKYLPRAKAGSFDQGGGMQKRSKLRRRFGGANQCELVVMEKGGEMEEVARKTALLYLYSWSGSECCALRGSLQEGSFWKGSFCHTSYEVWGGHPSGDVE